MKGETRCVEGTLFRHDPQPDDPHLETRIGICEECNGKGCEMQKDPLEQWCIDNAGRWVKNRRMWGLIDGGTTVEIERHWPFDKPGNGARKVTMMFEFNIAEMQLHMHIWKSRNWESFDDIFEDLDLHPDQKRFLVLGLLPDEFANFTAHLRPQTTGLSA